MSPEVSRGVCVCVCPGAQAGSPGLRDKFCCMQTRSSPEKEMLSVIMKRENLTHTTHTHTHTHTHKICKSNLQTGQHLKPHLGDSSPNLPSPHKTTLLWRPKRRVLLGWVCLPDHMHRASLTNLCQRPRGPPPLPEKIPKKKKNNKKTSCTKVILKVFSVMFSARTTLDYREQCFGRRAQSLIAARC